MTAQDDLEEAARRFYRELQKFLEANKATEESEDD